jgi:hypothetical protein
MRKSADRVGGDVARQARQAGCARCRSGRGRRLRKPIKKGSDDTGADVQNTTGGRYQKTSFFRVLQEKRYDVGICVKDDEIKSSIVARDRTMAVGRGCPGEAVR